jgi:glutathione peroxidase
MKSILTLVAGLAFTVAASAADKGDSKVSGPLSFKMISLDGKSVDLSQYKGKVVMFVNVASQCGATPQYADLQKLYDKYGKDGLVIVGVPANEFGAQEPGSNEEIAKFCESNYKVTFPMMSKVVVKGKGISPLYDYLTSKDTNPDFAGPIGWNFEKFLISREGKVVGRFKTAVKPTDEKFVKAIQTELEKK